VGRSAGLLLGRGWGWLGGRVARAPGQALDLTAAAAHRPASVPPSATLVADTTKFSR
jgi:hypothetical protein